VAWSKRRISLSLRKHVSSMLFEVGLLGYRPMDAPMDLNSKFLLLRECFWITKDDPADLCGETKLFISDSGRYCILGDCCEIVFITPQKSCWDVVIWILRYLKCAPNKALLYTEYGHGCIAYCWVYQMQIR